MEKIGQSIVKVLKNINDQRIIKEVKEDTLKLCRDFPIYNGLEY